MVRTEDDQDVNKLKTGFTYLTEELNGTTTKISYPHSLRKRQVNNMAIKSKTRQSKGHTATSWSSGVTQPRRGHPAIGSGDITHLCSQITTKSGQIINCWFFFSDSLGLPSFFSSSSSCQLLTEQINCCVSTELQPASAIPNAAAIYECTLLMPSVVTPR